MKLAMETYSILSEVAVDADQFHELVATLRKEQPIEEKPSFQIGTATLSLVKNKDTGLWYLRDYSEGAE